MLSKTQQKFLVKLKENEIYAEEQRFWCKKFFYYNVSFLMRCKLIKSRKDYDYNRSIYSLTELGYDFVKLLNQIKEVKFK